MAVHGQDQATTQAVRTPEVRRGPQAQTSEAPPASLAEVGTLSPTMVLRLQRRIGNAAVAEVIAGAAPPRRSGPVVQRRVMSDKEWKKASSRFGKFRSANLLSIDQILMEYNKAAGKPAAERRLLLTRLLGAINHWRLQKQDDDSLQVVSSRAEAVEQLRVRVVEERDELDQTLGPVGDLTNPGILLDRVKDLFEAASKQARDILADTPERSRPFQVQMDAYDDQMTDIWNGTPDDAETPEMVNAVMTAYAAAFAVEAMADLTNGYVKGQPEDVVSADNLRLRVLEGMNRLEGEEEEKAPYLAFIIRMNQRVHDYHQIVESVLAASGGDGGEVDTEMIEGILDVVDKSSGFSGYFGTGGKGNEGLNEFYKPEKQGESGLTKDVRETFNSGESRSQGDQNMISGVSDSLNHLSGVIGDTMALQKARATWRDPSSTPKEKREAAFVIAAYGPKLISHYGALTGGMLTAAKQGNKVLPGSNFGFGKTDGVDNGTDLSTDFKLVGDIAGWIAGAIETLGKIVTLIKDWFGKKEEPEEQEEQTFADKAESLGTKLAQLADLGQSAAGNYKSAAKLVLQIQGGGQISEAGKTTLSNIAPAELMPAMGIITGGMGAIRHGYGLYKVGMRRRGLTKHMKTLTRNRRTKLETIQAVEFTQESLVKRTNRTGIKLGHALASIVASGLDMSGIGAAPGMIIKISSTALQLGQVILRKGKQYARDKKAESRSKKDEERGFTESFAEWQLRKKKEAAYIGRGQQFLTAIDIFFTRNWDKSTPNKVKDLRQAALAIMDMEGNDKDEVFKALGITPKKLREEGKTELDVIMEALKKRES